MNPKDLNLLKDNLHYYDAASDDPLLFKIEATNETWLVAWKVGGFHLLLNNSTWSNKNCIDEQFLFFYFVYSHQSEADLPHGCCDDYTNTNHNITIASVEYNWLEYVDFECIWNDIWLTLIIKDTVVGNETTNKCSRGSRGE